MSAFERKTNHHPVITLFACSVAAGFGLAASSSASAFGGACSTTSVSGLVACKFDVKDDLYQAFAICTNVSDSAERAECYSDAWEERSEGREECGEVFEARQEVCEAIGQSRYDPDIDPDDFSDDFANQNPFWPLAVGNKWVYEGEDEEIIVEVKDETKLIQGVTCIVVNDIANEDDVTVESTDDWYGLHLNGDVRYFGEISKNFEVFEGDDPEEPELVDVEGSWKADRDGAKSGVLIFAAPQVGQVYRQEWAFGDAEDMGEVLSNDYSYGNDEELDEFVPEELAELMCNDDCVVTRDFTPLEPDVEERKYYAPGIGLFLEVDPESGEIVQLAECNLVDPRCDAL